MPPPAKKKRKTNDGGGSTVATGTRRTTRSQKPCLSIEVVAKVAAFCQYDNGDLMNICIAVGRKDSGIIRHACLRNNLNYLEYCLEAFIGDEISHSDLKLYISHWIEMNPDWRKHCTKERTEDEELAIVTCEDEDGEAVITRTNSLIIFNNPAAAIDFDLVDVLKYLVEEIEIDINSNKWVGFRFPDKCHLLYLSYLHKDDTSNACFDYLVSKKELDPNWTLSPIRRVPRF